MRTVANYCPRCTRIRYFGEKHYTANIPVDLDMDGAVVETCPDCKAALRDKGKMPGAKSWQT